MASFNRKLLMIVQLSLFVLIHNIYCETPSATKKSDIEVTENPLADLIINHAEKSSSGEVKTVLSAAESSRVKRQIIYDPYPVPIIIGGWFGGGGFGGRGFGGRGFGGRGYGGFGRGGGFGGFGGRGFGGLGRGGGFGGFGGRGRG